MPLLLTLIAAFAALLTIAASAAEIVPPQTLKRDWLDGRTVTTVGPRGGRSDFAFREDGTLTRSGGRADAARQGTAQGATQGTWRLDEEGFCMTLAQGKPESCYVALKDEGGAIRVLRRTGAFIWTR